MIESASSIIEGTFLSDNGGKKVFGREIVEERENLSSMTVENPEIPRLFVEERENLSPTIVENPEIPRLFVENVENLSPTIVENDINDGSWRKIGKLIYRQCG